ncbi:MAG: DUF2752 domain-containing protein [Acidobacteria bacterium]|nr:MAG: DUF2752 domain-containing protein [Acidobacteriota bacterium]
MSNETRHPYHPLDGRPRFPAARRRQDRCLSLMGTLALPLLLIALAIWTPPSEPGFIICGFRHLTGLPCPGCGMTRGISAFLKGDWRLAVHFNPFAPIVCFIFIVWWVRSLSALMGWRQVMRSLDQWIDWCRRPNVGWACWGVIMAFWVFRLWVTLDNDGLTIMRQGWLFRWFF